MALGFELIVLLMEYSEHIKKINTNPLFESISNEYLFIPILLSNINQLFCQNAKLLPQTNTSDENINISENIIYCSEKINTEIVNIISYIDHTRINEHDIPNDWKLIKKTDLTNFNFRNSSCLKKLYTFKKIPKDVLISYYINTYCKLCSMSLTVGWLLGCSRLDMVDNLDRLGYHFGLLLKLSNDFVNLEKDILLTGENQCTYNYVINYGLQESFELFDECKKNFYKGVMTLDIATATIKEIITSIDNSVMNVIEQSSPDIKQSISSSHSR
jgi:hypothetical protein